MIILLSLKNADRQSIKIDEIGERRDSNPRIMESQPTTLPLGYVRFIVLKIKVSSVGWYSSG